MSSVNPPTLAPGAQVAQYEIECVLGQGSMGVVYLALQRNLDRMVALKVLRPSLAQDKEFVQRFFNEARAAAALSHAHIVQAYDAGAVEPDIYYFVMEYVRGDTLYDRVQAEGPVKWPEALSIAHDLAEALNHGWKRQKLVHGDIKPENVMTCPEGGIKLADFGLAKMTEHDFAGEGIMLTPLYAAPEAIRGEVRGVDCRGDIYSFGATLYHLLCGEPPFPGTDPKEVMSRHLTEAVPPLSTRGLEIPKELCDFVCVRMLAKDPAQRPQNWDEVLAALGQLRERRSRKVAVSVPVAGQHSVAYGAHGHEQRAKTGVHPASVYLLPKKRPSVLFRLLLLLVIGLAVAAGIYFVVGRKSVRWPPWSPQSAAAIRPVAAHEPPVKKNAAKQKTTPTCSQSKPVVSPLFSPPPVKKPEPPPLPPMPVLPPASAGEPVPAVAPPAAAPPVVAIQEPQLPPSAELACRRADELVELLQDAASLLARQQGGLDPLMRRCGDWQAAHPEPSPELATVKLFMERAVPGVEEFFPKLLLLQDKLVGMPIPYVKGGTLPLRKFSATELVMLQRNPFGEAAVRQGWGDVNRQQLLTQFGLKVMGGANLSAQEKAPLLAFLLVTGQNQLAAEQLAALPDSPEKEGWQQLGAVFQQQAVEGPAVQRWRAVEAAWKTQQFGAVYKGIRRLKETASQAAVRHADDMQKMLRQCQLMVPSLQASALIQQAMEKMTTSPEVSLNRLNCAMARFGNAEFPEKEDVPRLREKAISLLAAKTLQEDNPVRWRQFAPCADVVRLPYPGASAAMYAILRESGSLPPFIQSRMAKLYPLTLLEMGDWAGAKALLKDRLVLGAESRVPPRLKGVILFGQTLVARRFGAADISVQSQNQRLSELLEVANNEPLPEPPPGGAPADEEFRNQGLMNRPRQTVFVAMLMVDSVFWGCAWEAEPAWPSLSRLAELDFQSGAGALMMSILACDLESGHRQRAEEFLANLPPAAGVFGAARPFVDGIAAVLHGTADEVALPANVSPEMRERAGRLWVSAYLIRLPSLPPAAAAAAAETGAAIRPVGWLGATAWFDLLLARVALELGQKDYEGAQVLLRQAVEETSPCAAAYYPRLRLLQAGIATAAGDTGRAREFLDMVPLSQAANAAELAAANPDKPAPALAPGMEAEAMFWKAWTGWSSAVQNRKPDAARAQAEKMLGAAGNLAQKRLAQALLPAGMAALPVPPP